MSDTNTCDVITFKFFTLVKKSQNFHLLKLIMALMFQCYNRCPCLCECFVAIHNFYLNWRDSFSCNLAPDTPKPEDFPAVCRYVCIHVYIIFALLELWLLSFVAPTLQFKGVSCF